MKKYVSIVDPSRAFQQVFTSKFRRCLLACLLASKQPRTSLSKFGGIGYRPPPLPGSTGPISTAQVISKGEFDVDSEDEVFTANLDGMKNDGQDRLSTDVKTMTDELESWTDMSKTTQNNAIDALGKSIETTDAVEGHADEGIQGLESSKESLKASEKNLNEAFKDFGQETRDAEDASNLEFRNERRALGEEMRGTMTDAQKHTKKRAKETKKVLKEELEDTADDFLDEFAYAEDNAKVLRADELKQRFENLDIGRAQIADERDVPKSADGVHKLSTKRATLLYTRLVLGSTEADFCN